jgi:hypothetical protein
MLPHTLRMPRHTLLLAMAASSLLVIAESYNLSPPLLAYRGLRPTLYLGPARNRCADVLRSIASLNGWTNAMQPVPSKATLY